VKLLNDRRPVVWWRAINELAARGEAALDELDRFALLSRDSERQQLGAVWALARIDHPKARQRVCDFLVGPRDARQAAIHVVSLWRDRDWETGNRLEQLLSSLLSSPHHRRAAAEALGRIGNSRAVPTILSTLAEDAADRLDPIRNWHELAMTGLGLRMLADLTIDRT